MARFSAFAITLALALVGAEAFVKPAANMKAPTKVFSSEAPELNYGEESRKYRRTVFTHEDWVKHRSPDRFTRQLTNIVSSGVYKNIAREVFATTSVAVFVCVYNAIFHGYTDFNGVNHASQFEGWMLPLLALPLTPFTLSSPSLGLLLGEKYCCVVLDQCPRKILTKSMP